jgi:hypothetical protein
MFTMLMLGAIWALVGVPMGIRHARERRSAPMEEFQRAISALQGPGPTPAGPLGSGPGVDVVSRRRIVSTLTYLPGAVLGLVGLVVGDSGMLTAAVGLLNVGTAHRLVGLRIDKVRRRTPVLPRPYVLPPAPLEPPFDPGVDERSGDGQTWGDGWKIIGPEPRGIRDLVLVDADVS